MTLLYSCLTVSSLFLCEEQEDEEASTGSHLKLIVDAFIQQLPNCVNRDLIDKARREQHTFSVPEGCIPCLTI